MKTCDNCKSQTTTKCKVANAINKGGFFCFNNNYKDWESKEDTMKVIYKSPMTEEEQRNAINIVFEKYYMDRKGPNTYNHLDYVNEVMGIAKNDSKEIWGVEMKLYSTEVPAGEKKITFLTKETIEEAYKLIHP